MYESADAVSATNSAWLTQVWETARLRNEGGKCVPECLLVVDEIQKIENWVRSSSSNRIRIREKNINIKVILLGIFPIIDSERTHRVIGRTFRNVLSRSLVFC